MQKISQHSEIKCQVKVKSKFELLAAHTELLCLKQIPFLLFCTCERSQFDTAGYVVVKEDPPSFVVAFDDGI